MTPSIETEQGEERYLGMNGEPMIHQLSVEEENTFTKVCSNHTESPTRCWQGSISE